MHELTDVFRRIVIDDSIDSLDIQASSCQISGHEYLYFACSKLADDFLSLLLTFTSVVFGYCPLRSFLNHLGYFITVLSRVHEHDYGSRKAPKYLCQSIWLAGFVDELDMLIDLLFSSARFTNGDVDEAGREVRSAEHLNLGYHGSAEHMYDFLACSNQ